MEIKQTYITKNPCYKTKENITPKGIMVHSTAAPGVMASGWFSRWNKSTMQVAVHAFVDDKEVCQHLPWNHRAWHCGDSGNNTHISFEMCEPSDWKTNATYFKKCYQNAVELAAYLCQKYNLKTSAIISHKEGHAKGIASNHGDPDHWWKYFGYTMAKFRADVDKVLKGGKITVNVSVSTERETVKVGSTGSDVKYLQQRLNAMKTYLKLSFAKLTDDGDFGAKTLAAVKEFQKSRKLTVDGIVGKNTWAALDVNYGDVNADGKVNAVDAQKVLKAAVGKDKLTDKQKKSADMNADGKVNAVDAQQILKRAVGK